MRETTMFSSDAELDRIGLGLIGRTLPKSEWTHAGHFAAALWLLVHRPAPDPVQVMPGMIRAYNEATGVQNTETAGYHATITLASIGAARAFLAAHVPAPLFCICNDLLSSELGSPDWVLAYWSEGVLFSKEARAGWVKPDKKDLLF